ncbi:MAG TPA: hypothetical protein VF666_01795 [Pyrinomonadaceae bacterium]|jgi:hypothetical protein
MLHQTCVNCGFINSEEVNVCEQCGVRLRDEGRGTHYQGDARASSFKAETGTDERTLPVILFIPPFDSISAVLNPTFRLYRYNFGLIVSIVLVLAVPHALVQYFLQTAPAGSGTGINWLLEYAGGSLMSGALIYAVMTFFRTGKNPTVGESYRWALKKWGKVLLCTLLFTLITWIGYLFLIIPGIILSLMFALVVPIAVIEDKGITDTFQRSRELTEGYRLGIFATQFLLGILIVGILYLSGRGWFGGQEGDPSIFMVSIYTLITQLLQASFTVLSLFIYLGILANKSLTEVPAYNTQPDAGFDERLLR